MWIPGERLQSVGGWDVRGTRGEQKIKPHLFEAQDLSMLEQGSRRLRILPASMGQIKRGGREKERIKRS